LASTSWLYPDLVSISNTLWSFVGNKYPFVHSHLWCKDLAGCQLKTQNSRKAGVWQTFISFTMRYVASFIFKTHFYPRWSDCLFICPE
jgi:hypothetical protein